MTFFVLSTPIANGEEITHLRLGGVYLVTKQPTELDPSGSIKMGKTHSFLARVESLHGENAILHLENGSLLQMDAGELALQSQQLEEEESNDFLLTESDHKLSIRKIRSTLTHNGKTVGWVIDNDELVQVQRDVRSINVRRILPAIRGLIDREFDRDGSQRSFVEISHFALASVAHQSPSVFTSLDTLMTDRYRTPEYEAARAVLVPRGLAPELPCHRALVEW